MKLILVLVQPHEGERRNAKAHRGRSMPQVQKRCGL